MKLKISGPGINKSNIPVETIVDVLTAVRNSVLLIYEAGTKKDTAAGVPSRVKDDNVPLSIVDISDGSATITLDAPLDQQYLFENSTPTQVALSKFFEILEAVECHHEERIKAVLPEVGSRNSIMRQVENLVRKQKADRSVSVMMEGRPEIVTPSDDWYETISSIIESENETLSTEILGSVIMVHARKYKAELLTGTERIVIKDPDLGKSFKELLDHSVKVRGTISFQNAGEMILMEIEDLQDFTNETEINSLYYEGKLYKFSSPIRLLKTIDEYDLVEIACPELRIFGYGEEFEDAWEDFRRAFDTAVYILQNSKIPISESDKQFELFFKNSCEVTSCGL